MATPIASNSSDQLTPAQQLMQKHISSDDQPLSAKVEEVVDQDDLEHPPPSSTLPHRPDHDAVLPEQKPTAKKSTTLDTTSEELFPSLGGPRSASGTGQSHTWSKKPSIMTMNNHLNPNNNGPAIPGRVSAGGMSPNGSVTSPGPLHPKMSLPGRYSEQVVFAPSQLLPRSQLKKPVIEVLREINKRSKAEVKMSNGPNSCVIFEGTGPVDAVRQALKDVAKEVGSKQSTKVTIPASVRPHIIGKGGSTISKLSQRSGARIQVPRQDAVDGPLEIGDEDDSAMVDIIIEGDAISAEMARRQIEEIVNERTSTLNLRMNDIPPEFYPFLAGPLYPGIESIIGGRDVRIDIPKHMRHRKHKQPTSIVDKSLHNPIRIQGERQAAMELRQALEQQVARLQQQFTSDQLSVERGRHEFIMNDVDDVMKQTGCAIIFPAEDDDSEFITIVGPPDNIEAGTNKVIDIASSMSMSSVDIARQHPHAPRGAHHHARNVTRYLKRKNALKKLEQAHSARVLANSAPDAPTAWEVFSSDAKNAMRARTDIMNLVSAHPPERFAPVQVDPFYHQYLAENAAQRIRDDQGVFLVLPDDDQEDSSEVLLVFEGGPSDQYEVPRKQATQQEAQQFGQSLQDAQNVILQLCSGGQEIVIQDMEAPLKFHDKIRKHVLKRHQASNKIPVQLRTGADAAKRRNLPHSNHVSMRGPQDDVAEMMTSLMAFIEQEEKDELERGFQLSFDFPQNYANQLIGKGGSNIKKLKEDFDVDIQVNEGKVEITGPEAKANACKAHIKALEKRLADEATHVLKIAPQFHKDLIGAKGSQVNRLQDRYNVRINFPRSAQTSSEGGEEDSRRANQPADEVIVRGPKSGADGARSELLDLLQYVKDNSFETSISVPQTQLPKLIGSNGRELEALRLSTGAHIDIPKKTENASANDKVDIKISGTKKAVDEACKFIKEAVKVHENTISEDLDIASDKHGLLIGRNGDTRSKIEREFNVNLDIPRQHTGGPAGSIVKVKGDPAAVEKATKYIFELVKDHEKTTIHVPSKLHHMMSNNGQFFRDLNRDFKVRVDHGGVSVPSRPAPILPRSFPTAPSTANLPLITDETPLSPDTASELVHIFECLPLFSPNSSASQSENDLDSMIPWILSGADSETLSKATTRVENAKQAAERNNTIGFLTLADPKLYKKVIGQGGSTVKKLREKNGGVKVNVPKKESHHGHGQGQGQHIRGSGSEDQQQSEAIELIGSMEGVEGVRDEILSLVGGTLRII